MNKTFRFMAATLIVASTAQTFGMTRLLSRVKACGSRLRPAIAARFMPARLLTKASPVSRFAPATAKRIQPAVAKTLKPAAFTLLSGTAAGLALNSQAAKAEGGKPAAPQDLTKGQANAGDKREIITTFGHIDALVSIIDMVTTQKTKAEVILSEISFLSYHKQKLEEIDSLIYISNKDVPKARERLKNEILLTEKKINDLLALREKTLKEVKQLEELCKQAYDDVVLEDEPFDDKD